MATLVFLLVPKRKDMQTTKLKHIITLRGSTLAAQLRRVVLLRQETLVRSIRRNHLNPGISRCPASSPTVCKAKNGSKHEWKKPSPVENAPPFRSWVANLGLSNIVVDVLPKQSNSLSSNLIRISTVELCQDRAEAFIYIGKPSRKVKRKVRYQLFQWKRPKQSGQCVYWWHSQIWVPCCTLVIPTIGKLFRIGVETSKISWMFSSNRTTTQKSSREMDLWCRATTMVM